jgi:hypothetical protein
MNAFRMNPFRNGAISCLLLALAACSTPAPAPTPQALPLEQRISDLERRVELLEARPAVALPYRDRAEIEAHIRMLEAERAALLGRYLPDHPLIRDIDRRLAILNTQLDMLE